MLRGKDWCQLYSTNSDLSGQRYLRAGGHAHIVLNVSLGIYLKYLQIHCQGHFLDVLPNTHKTFKTQTIEKDNKI